VLLVAIVSFALELCFPHMSSAAYENYMAIGNGEGPKYYQTALGIESYGVPLSQIIEREEGLIPAQQDEQPIGGLPDNDSPQVIREHWLTVTAYSSTPDQTDATPYTTGWITPVRDGVVALNFLPKGTLVRFPDMFGDKIFVVEDAMNVRYPYRADIWMYTREIAQQFGIKYLRMEELDARVSRSYVLNHYTAAFPDRK